MTHVSDATLLRKATINCCDTPQQLWSVCHWISASSPANWWTSSRVMKRICLQIPTFVRVVTEALQRLVVHVEPKDKQSLAQMYQSVVFVTYTTPTGWDRERTIINPAQVLLKGLLFTQYYCAQIFMSVPFVKKFLLQIFSCSVT